MDFLDRMVRLRKKSKKEYEEYLKEYKLVFKDNLRILYECGEELANEFDIKPNKKKSNRKV